MIGSVARATHKHFRDVNKCVQKGAIETVSGLLYRKCCLFSPFLSSDAQTHTKHMHKESVLKTAAVFPTSQGHKPLSAVILTVNSISRWASTAHSHPPPPSSFWWGLGSTRSIGGPQVSVLALKKTTVHFLVIISVAKVHFDYHHFHGLDVLLIILLTQQYYAIWK